MHSLAGRNNGIIIAAPDPLVFQGSEESEPGNPTTGPPGPPGGFDIIHCWERFLDSISGPIPGPDLCTLNRYTYWNVTQSIAAKRRQHPGDLRDTGYIQSSALAVCFSAFNSVNGVNSAHSVFTAFAKQNPAPTRIIVPRPFSPTLGMLLDFYCSTCSAPKAPLPQGVNFSRDQKSRGSGKSLESTAPLKRAYLGQRPLPIWLSGEQPG